MGKVSKEKYFPWEKIDESQKEFINQRVCSIYPLLRQEFLDSLEIGCRLSEVQLVLKPLDLWELWLTTEWRRNTGHPPTVGISYVKRWHNALRFSNNNLAIFSKKWFLSPRDFDILCATHLDIQRQVFLIAADNEVVDKSLINDLIKRRETDLWKQARRTIAGCFGCNYYSIQKGWDWCQLYRLAIDELPTDISIGCDNRISSIEEIANREHSSKVETDSQTFQAESDKLEDTPKKPITPVKLRPGTLDKLSEQATARGISVPEYIEILPNEINDLRSRLSLFFQDNIPSFDLWFCERNLPICLEFKQANPESIVVVLNQENQKIYAFFEEEVSILCENLGERSLKRLVSQSNRFAIFTKEEINTFVKLNPKIKVFIYNGKSFSQAEALIS